jgi:hypothetical protein
MIEVLLYIRGTNPDVCQPADVVTTVMMPRMTSAPEAIWWGQRLFIRRDDTHYVEGICWVASRLSTQPV